MEFTADLRLTAELTADHRGARGRGSVRRSRRPIGNALPPARSDGPRHPRKRRRALAEDAKAQAGKTPIDGRWLSYQIGQALGDDCIVFDDTIVSTRFTTTCNARGRARISTIPAAAADGRPARRSAPSSQRPIARRRDHRRRLLYVRHRHPLAVVRGAIQRALSDDRLPEPQLFDGNVARGADLSRWLRRKGRLPGGYFEPPIDFAAEARSAGAYGENVTDPSEVGPALQRGLKSVREGTSAVISVWLPRLLQTD